MTDYVHYKLEDGIAHLTMDDGKANALNVSMSKALADNLNRANEEADVVIISGRPGLLCAGFDLKVINGSPEEREAMVNAGGHLLLKAYLHPQPIVIACTGHAIAAGALLTLTADYRIGASGDFRIGLNETSIGLSLPVFGLELTRDRLDNRHLTQATMNATLYEPGKAAEVGYLDEVVAPETLQARALELAQGLQKLDAKAFAQVKRGVREASGAKILKSLP
jgi:enoyl-CoA hydratase